MKGPIYIGNVKMAPTSTREEPWRFVNLREAAALSSITRQVIWCCIGPDPDLFRVYPGGRIEDFTLWLDTPHAKRRLARRSEVPAPDPEPDGSPIENEKRGGG